MGLRPGERVLVIVDEPLRAAGEALCATARALGAGRAEVRVVPGSGAGLGAGAGRAGTPTARATGASATGASATGATATRATGAPATGAPGPALAVIPAAYLRQVSEADVILSLLSGLDLRRESPWLRAGLAAFRAAARGRWAAGACIDQAVLEEDLVLDCRAIAARTAATAARLARARQVRLVTEAGTDLTFSIAGRPVYQDAGVLRGPGAYGNLPAGEAFVAPLEESAEGRVVIDLSLGDIPLDEPVTLTFRGGRAVAVEGGSAARELVRRLGTFDPRPGPGSGPGPGTGPGPWTLGEFGLGTNPGARLRGRAPLDEKVLGTAHIALGSNAHFGGANEAETHYDCVISQPSIYLDGEKL